MELHLPLIFVCLILAPMVIHAALPPELYWKSMLPNTTMPKAVKDLLKVGNVQKDPNNQILFWKRVSNDQLHNDPNNQILFWKRVSNDQLHNDPNNQILFWKRVLTDQLHDDPNNQILFWKRVPTDQLHDDPNNQILFWQRVPTDQLHDDPNNQILFWKRVPTDQLHDDPNNQILFWQRVPTDQLHDDPNNQILFWKRIPTDQLHDDPNNQILFWKRIPTDQLHDDPNNQILFWKRVPTDQLHDDPNNQILFWQRVPTDQLHDDPNNQILFGKRVPIDQLHDDPNNQILFWQRVPTDQLHDDPNNQILFWQHATIDQSLDESSKFLFLSENDLHPGNKLEMLFTKSPYSKVLIPREVADTIPFSLENLPEILKMFSVEPLSKEAQLIKRAIHHCKEPSNVKGEEKHCATSLESMIDYITSKLGKNLKAYSTEVEKETQFQRYTIAPGLKKISDEVMACHQAHYPYVLFHCHKSGGSTRAYFVPLEGFDGTRVKAIVVCHSDTSDWDPDHLAFRTLKIKRGTAPVCHFSPADNIIWTPHKAT